METKQKLNVPMDIAEITMLVASVERSLSSISSRFDMDGSQFWKTSDDPAQVWMNENYETVAGAVLTAANALNIVYRALDENMI